MTRLLETYHGPEDLRKLSLPQMEGLCEELRQLIMEVTEANGGHLGSNLGVVELTVALLRLYDFRKDRIIWDVGHQSYSYKILTDRLGSFHSLRTEGGLAGFPKREESPYDAFNTGHSSTSLSAALGLARAAALRGETQHTVAVIGDGAMTGGMVWEALNNMTPEDDCLIILNDNEMSIAPIEGSFSRHLQALRVHPSYLKLKPRVRKGLRHLPLLGKPLGALAIYLKKRTRLALEPPHMIFENLGIRYYGPVDGHDIKQLLRYLQAVQHRRGPRILHVFTKKGKGYDPAEACPADYHGVAPDFCKKKEERSSPSKSFTSAFGEAIVKLGAEDPRLCAITAAMPQGTGLIPFSEAYPRRFFDVGIAEQHAVTYAAGLAAGGLRPVVAVYSTFLQRAMDQVIHDVCLQNLPVTFALDRGGLVGADGETHQGVFDLAQLLPLPNLHLSAPRDPAQVERHLRFALSTDAPSVLRYPKGSTPEIPSLEKEGTQLQPTLLREGTDLCLVAVGSLAQEALLAASQLQEEGYSIRVVDPEILKPLPMEGLLRCLLPHRPVLVVEEGSRVGGFGSYLKEGLGEMFVVTLAGLPDEAISQASVSSARQRYGLDARGIAKRLRQLLSEQNFSSTSLQQKTS